MPYPITFKKYKKCRYRYIAKNGDWEIEFPGGLHKEQPDALRNKTEEDVTTHIDNLLTRIDRKVEVSKIQE